MSYSLAESFLSGLVQDIAEQQEVKVLFSFIIIQAITPYVYKCQNNDQNMELIGKFTCKPLAFAIGVFKNAVDILDKL